MFRFCAAPPNPNPLGGPTLESGRLFGFSNPTAKARRTPHATPAVENRVDIPSSSTFFRDFRIVSSACQAHCARSFSCGWSRELLFGAHQHFRASLLAVQKDVIKLSERTYVVRAHLLPCSAFLFTDSVPDDVANRLKPTLPPPRTCDLIDINPGIGLWSKTLHELLQPRRHILVESALERYEDTLGPLLRQPGSPYRHASNLEEALDPQNELLSKYATDKGGSGGKLPQFNDSLLVTMNLSSRKVRSGGWIGGLGNKFFDDLFFSLFSNPQYSVFRYGLVRMLAWMPEEKGSGPFLPRTAYRRTRSSITVETVADVTEVAGVSAESVSTRYKRWPRLDMDEYVALSTAKKTNSVAEGRRDPPPAPELLSIEPTAHNLRTQRLSTDATWVAEFLECEDRLKLEDPDFIRLFHNGEVSRADAKTPLQLSWATRMQTASTCHRSHMKAVEEVEETRRLISDWKTAFWKADRKPVAAYRDKALRRRGDAVHRRIQALDKTSRLWAEKAIDDCRAADMSPPMLLHSRRQTDPLIVRTGEFEPPNRRMALLDVVPHRTLLGRVDTYDKVVCTRHVMATFSGHMSQSVADALKLLVHDTGVDAFVKTVPGIHDPTQGGWYDLKQLRLRALPAQMFVEIALSYESWPFRSSISSMLLTSPDTQDEFTAPERGLH